MNDGNHNFSSVHDCCVLCSRSRADWVESGIDCKPPEKLIIRAADDFAAIARRAKEIEAERKSTSRVDGCYLDVG